MGLSERKVKQRIGADPRNLAWAENAAKFGHTYLAKHGWAPGAGLGVTGDGRVSHIAVAQKLDQLGIGAGRPDGPDSIAWKQAKEFEGLLERLNAASGGADGGDKEAEVVKESAEEGPTGGGDDGDETKRKEDKARRKEKKKEEKRRVKAEAAATESSGSAPSTPSTSTPESTPVAVPAPRRLAHRARFLAAKRLSGTSSTALSEILGVASTPTSTSESTPTPSTPATPRLTEIPVLDDSNRITTSSQSVADYFKNKMRQRAQATGGLAATSTAVITFEEPDVGSAARTGLGASRQDQEEIERPKGLGFTNTSMGLGFTSASTGLGYTRTASPSPTDPIPTLELHPLAPTSDNSESTKSDKEARKEKKRKRKDQADTFDVPAAEVNEAEEEERKAAKRARKEAKRAAREQQQGSAGDSADRSSKKKKKREVKED
ncbi:G-patch domain protein [Rhizoctonia solani 123E]|uniref:PinX1-related protein 1 n=1 Tax=Rhizoctonia solani 123E TaxID=1423351 RepID=A0A074SFS1_9AGAM|nr:G-patch domain protein [Rhizoctonia solani 123E]